jgi:hypothetical protein
LELGVAAEQVERGVERHLVEHEPPPGASLRECGTQETGTLEIGRARIPPKEPVQEIDTRAGRSAYLDAVTGQRWQDKRVGDLRCLGRTNRT